MQYSTACVLEVSTGMSRRMRNACHTFFVLMTCFLAAIAIDTMVYAFPWEMGPFSPDSLLFCSLAQYFQAVCFLRSISECWVTALGCPCHGL